MGYSSNIETAGRNFFGYDIEVKPLLKMEHIPTSPNWEVGYYADTQRVKSTNFSQIMEGEEILNEAYHLYNEAARYWASPLVQSRFIMPVAEEGQLWERTAMLSNSRDYQVRLNGRIPFQVQDVNYGIYYLTIENRDRDQNSYRQQLQELVSHDEAVKIGLAARERDRKLPRGHQIQMVDYSRGIDSGFELEELANRIAALHRECFEYAHDQAQTTVEGQMQILEHNPVLFDCDENGRIASVVLCEKNGTITIPLLSAAGRQITVYEPTCFTSPDFRRMGLSAALRREMIQLLETDSWTDTIVFNESITHRSFITALGSGHDLAGDPCGVIDGNLSDAYTYIGPANPQTGLMPMGLTFSTSNNLSIQSS